MRLFCLTAAFAALMTAQTGSDAAIGSLASKIERSGEHELAFVIFYLPPSGKEHRERLRGAELLLHLVEKAPGGGWREVKLLRKGRFTGPPWAPTPVYHGNLFFKERGKLDETMTFQFTMFLSGDALPHRLYTEIRTR